VAQNFVVFSILENIALRAQAKKGRTPATPPFTVYLFAPTEDMTELSFSKQEYEWWLYAFSLTIYL
jgi:hypothetical protein